MDDLETGVFESHTAYEKQHSAKTYFKQVIEAYNEIGLLSPIVAINPDPLAKSTKLDVYGIHFLADVELATKKALGHNTTLIEQWQRLINGETVENAAAIMSRCGRLYKARQLAPFLYFRFIKQGRKRHQSDAVAQQGAA